LRLTIARLQDELATVAGGERPILATAGRALAFRSAREDSALQQTWPAADRIAGLEALMTDATQTGATPAAPIVIKKYANRRLYNTATSAYVTLDHLSAMVREGADFIVQDVKTGEDITRSVLTQIIFEQESSGGQALLPVQFLRRLIRFYGDQMQGYLPAYLEMSMESFAKGQERMRDQFRTAFGGNPALAAFEEQASRNMHLFEQAVRMWAPFGASAGAFKPPEAGDATGDAESLAELKRQMEAMQKQLDLIAGGRKTGA
jgi:polyhydroxyalkanoate synthesis repressor PhaR